LVGAKIKKMFLKVLPIFERFKTCFDKVVFGLWPYSIMAFGHNGLFWALWPSGQLDISLGAHWPFGL